MSRLNKEKIFLLDLTHTASGYASEFIPLGIGCIKAHLNTFSKHRGKFEAKLFRNPQRAIDAFLEEGPGLVAFSNYSWNFNLGKRIAREIKETHPETFIIFGGPNFPLESEWRKKWLRNNSQIDLYIVGDGEEPFQEVFDLWFDAEDLEEVKGNAIKGCHALLRSGEYRYNKIVTRVSNLDQAPSPYLLGYFDEFLKEESFIPMMETTRGCPFSCTFCEKGVGAWSKVKRKSVQFFKEELEYVAKRYDGKILALADDNFGMYNHDIDFSKAIAEVKKNFDYPYHINVSTGKNRKENLLEAAKILQGSLQVMSSVQSLDPEVLNNIKRENISLEVLMNTAQKAHSMEANTKSEVILGLPGDTLAKHRETLFKLIDSDIKFVVVYTFILLDGTEIATQKEREKFKLETMFRINSGCLGEYQFDGKKFVSAEIEEVCVASQSMSLQEYVDCRNLAFTIGVFQSDSILIELFHFLENFEIKTSEVIFQLFQNKDNFSKSLAQVFKEFEEATVSELWEREKDLSDYVYGHENIVDQYLKGEFAINVIFTYRARILKYHVQEVLDEAFHCAEQLINKKDPQAGREYKKYLTELKRFCVLRKHNVFDYEKRYFDSFSYDFRKLEKNDFHGFPRELEMPEVIEFYSTPQQKKMMTVHGTEILGIRKIFSRWDVSRLQRSLAFHPGNIEENNANKKTLLPLRGMSL